MNNDIEIIRSIIKESTAEALEPTFELFIELVKKNTLAMITDDNKEVIKLIIESLNEIQCIKK